MSAKEAMRALVVRLEMLHAPMREALRDCLAELFRRQLEQFDSPLFFIEGEYPAAIGALFGSVFVDNPYINDDNVPGPINSGGAAFQ